MSCYFRHIKDVLEESGVTVTPESKKEIDRILHGIAGVTYKDCPSTWKRIKEMVKGEPAERKRFVESLRKELKARRRKS